MTEIRPSLGAAFPQRHGGVVGHVARLQQLDTDTVTGVAGSGPAPREPGEPDAPEKPEPGAVGPDAAGPAAAVQNSADDGRADEPADDAPAAGDAAEPVASAGDGSVGARADDGGVRATDPGPFDDLLFLVSDENADRHAATFDDGDTVEIPLPAGGFFGPTGAEPADGARPAGRGSRRLKAAAFAIVVASLLAAAGGTYALLDGQTTARQALPRPTPGASGAVAPTVEPTFRLGPAPAAEPAGGASPTPSASSAAPEPAARPTSRPPQVRRAGAGRNGAGRPAYPPVAAPVAPKPKPGRPDVPPVQPLPDPPVVEQPAAQLTAAFTHQAEEGADGLTGFRGTVVISNPGEAAVNGWRVALTLPADNAVQRVRGARLQQDAAALIFTPGRATRTVPAGGSVTFTFRVDGVLPSAPSGCTIDGQPCG